MVVTENHNLKEGQLQAIAEAQKPRQPTMFFQKEDSSTFKQETVFPTSKLDPKESDSEALRAYQVETMRLKDELMQLRVDTFDNNQKMQRLKQEAHNAISKAD